MQTDLSGQVSLVTGAARGIGQAIADRLASSGSKVYYTDLDETEAQQAASSFEGCCGRAMDVTSPEAIDTLIHEV
ncbi:MAG: SDR family NAD(P)-dependent oxidoreductase, partial [Planctomycetota bacterium]|nr:SDR family NAD(P)-dependent oxidoreductase [Planctomycetota bacterium]